MKKRPFFVSWKYAALVVSVAAVLGCGRSPSRYLGKGAAQVIEVEDMKEFISMSFDRRGGSTVKDVTYLAGDGYIYTQEFKDFSPLEGIIRWVPHGEGSSFIQSRSISRWLGTAVNLELPDDCEQVLGVDVTYSTKNERSKNLVYRSRDGKILAREYREGLLARHLEGWIEVRAKKR